MLRSLTELLAPPTCSGCGAFGREWCADCASTPRIDARVDLGFVVHATFRFDGPVRRTIIDWKDEARADARDRVVRWFREGLEPVLARFPDAIVVPVPSAASAVRRRGRSALADAVRAAVPCRRYCQQLVAVRARRDQSGLDRAQRQENLRGSMAWAGGTNTPIILVDDVCTTGATLRESAHAIRAAGAQVEAAFVIAFREPRDPFVLTREGLRLPQNDNSGRFTWIPTTPHSNRT